MKIQWFIGVTMFGLGLSVGVQAETEAGIKAFARTLHPVLIQKCASCHGDHGEAVEHSVTNVEVAYGYAKELVDFSDIDGSVFMKRIRSKHWLKDDPTQAGMDEAEMKKLLNLWWAEGEFAAQQSFKFVSSAVSVPSSLPEMASGKYASMTWKLSDGNPGLAGCEFQLEIQRARAPGSNYRGSYRVRSPKLSCVGKSVSGKGIYFFVSGQLAAFENIYQATEFSVGAQENKILDSELMILIQRQEADQIQVLFKELSIN